MYHDLMSMYLVCTCTYLLLLLSQASGFTGLGFRDVLRDANIPVPDAQAHKDALEGGFLPSMTEEEQKRFTPSELLLYKHVLELQVEYRYKLV